MKAFYNPSLGLLLLRLALGIVFMAHGAQKLFGWFGGGGIAGTAGFFGSLGIPLPELFAWIVALVEFGGGLLLILGALTPIAAGLLAVNMLVAMLIVHLPRGFFIADNGIEFVMTLFAASLTLVLTGAGAYSLDARGLERGEPALA